MFYSAMPGSLFATWEGPLGTRGSLMLDMVILAMLGVVPVMTWSIWQVKYRRRYALHKGTQLVLAALLLVTVGAFELEMRLYGWTERARPSTFWRDGRWNDAIDYTLGIHLVFAIPTLLLWVVVVVQALRHFPRPVAPCAYSPRHRLWGRIAAIGLTLTAVSGAVFYYVAFVA